MKAIIIETGEQVEYIGTSAEYGTSTIIDADGVLQQGDFSGKIKILPSADGNMDPIDWEKRRFDVYTHLVTKYHPFDAVGKAERCVNYYRETFKI